MLCGQYHPSDTAAFTGNHDDQSEHGFGNDAEVVVQRVKSAAPVPVGQSKEWHDGLGSAKSRCT